MQWTSLPHIHTHVEHAQTHAYTGACMDSPCTHPDTNKRNLHPKLQIELLTMCLTHLICQTALLNLVSKRGYVRIVPCSIVSWPDNKEILHRNVLTAAEVRPSTCCSFIIVHSLLSSLVLECCRTECSQTFSSCQVYKRDYKRWWFFAFIVFNFTQKNHYQIDIMVIL